MLARAGNYRSIPDSFSLEQYEPPRLNQGYFGSCGGHGSAAALYIRYNVLGKPLGWIPSQQLIYAAARAETRAAVESGQLSELSDTGVQPIDMMRAISSVGICPMLVNFTADGRRSDVDGVNVDRELTIAEVEAAGRTIPSGMVALDTSAPDFTEQVCAYISQGIPVGAGIWVDQFFQQYTGGVLDHVNMQDPQGGWHFVCVVGYRTAPDGSRILKIVNSWGDSWGDGTGHVEISASRMNQATADAYAWAIT